MKKYILILLSICTILTTATRISAQTVGLFHNSAESFNGFTLFSGAINDSVYLMDNCGNAVHKWHSQYLAVRQPTHLLPDGNLLMGGSSNNTLFMPGAGMLQILDWTSHILWKYIISDSFQHAHHDFKPMPNGHILATVWEKKTPAEEIAKGRNPANALHDIWPDKIVELRPIGNDSAEIVWEWRVWDHLIQDFDPSAPNYGVISQHPELIDVNLLPLTNGSWNHVNSVDYNPKLDQIIISARNFNEVWIIDHSTTKAQARLHTGGNCGKGGDLLYRWGNPLNYQQGLEADQKLFGQHDAQWIKPGYPDSGMISIFNNGAARPGTDYSEVDLIQPPLLADGNYEKQVPDAYGPALPAWTYTAPIDSTFYSNTMGGATMQPNGDFLITEANTGELFEVNTAGSEVWRYVCPVQITSILSQGDPAGNNQVFKINRYDPSYSAFTTHPVSGGKPIELNPLPSNCHLFVTSVSDAQAQVTSSMTVYPNPALGHTTISFVSQGKTEWNLRVIDLAGRTILANSFAAQNGKNNQEIDISHLAKGIYLVELRSAGIKMQSRLMVE